MAGQSQRDVTLSTTIRGLHSYPSKWHAGFVVGLLLLLAVAACSFPQRPTGGTPTPLSGSPEVSVVVVTTDLAVGANRIAFGLVTLEGSPVRAPEAQFRAIYLPPGQAPGEVRATGTAKFQRWPIGPQGVFSTRLEFNQAGFWELEVSATRPDGKPVLAKGAFQVKEKPATPAIGAQAPRSVTPTVEGVLDLATITTANPPDPDLYRLSIHQALDAGKPLVVTFATPAFCMTATCGPSVGVLLELKDRYKDRANFIHVEIFQNPHLLQGGRPVGGYAPAVLEWGLPTEPFTFVMDGQGRVRAKFEGFTTGEEIEAALKEVF